MAKTLNYSILRTQAYAELQHSENAVSQQGLFVTFLILARCVFVRQNFVCPTKKLAPQGRPITPKS